MLRHFLFSVLIVLTAIGEGLAQQYNFKRFSVEEGLPRSGVYCLLEDSRGFLWIGTEGGGLSRFDGRKFVTYTTENGLPDNTIRALFEDASGTIWIGTDGRGLCSYDGRSFRTFNQANGLSHDYVRCITQGTEGDIWIGTFGGGIDRIRTKKDSISVTVYNTDGVLKSNNVRACLTGSDGTLWFGTDKGLTSFNGKTWSYFNEADGLPNERILVLFEDASKRLWVGTENGVSVRTANGFQSYTTQDGLISDRIRGISQDDIGNMWFGTQDGVSSFDGKGFRSFTEKNGLSNDRIRDIIKDRSGNMWFGTYFGGICRFSTEEFIHFTEADGISNNQVLSVFKDSSDQLWIGTLEGANLIRKTADGTFETIAAPLNSDISDHSVNIIVGQPYGALWFGTDIGILIKEGKKEFWFEADGQPFNENVKALLFDSDGSVWIGTTQGVTRFAKGEKGYNFDQYHSNPNINESEVSSLLTDKFGRVWVGYLKNSITVFDGVEFIQPDLPPSLTDVSSLIQGPNARIWIGTAGKGLFSYSQANEAITASAFTYLGKEDGLSSSDIHQLIFDKDKQLWIGTTSGIDRVAFDASGQPRKVTHFGRQEGFIGTETNENAICLDAEGKVWTGTIRGLTRCDSEAAFSSSIEAKLHITQVQLGFEQVDWRKTEYARGTSGYFELPLELRLPFRLNSIIISFDGIDLGAPEKVRYQWRLIGQSDDWSLVDESQTVTLTNIPSGKHEFMVRSCNGAGVWNKEPQTFSFVILPPFYLTWWFILLASLALVALVFIIIKIREKRHQADKLRLQTLVDERTVELRHEKERSDELLLNILPHETAEELKEKGFASVQLYDRVSVLFTDFVGFTNITEGISSKELVSSLDEHFRLFDGIMDKYGIEKIKTIGDAYMAAGGIPSRNNSNPLSVVAAGLEMIHKLKELNRLKESRGDTAWLLRLGIHTGSVISGVVGKNKFAFDIWGDAVNTAARMESSGDVMQVNVSGSTYAMIKDYFECTPRGKIKAKNKGEIEMYFVDRIKPEYSETEDGFLPNSTFLEIIRTQDENILLPD